MMRLIDTPEFQRLRRIKQVRLGLYTYQARSIQDLPTRQLGAFQLVLKCWTTLVRILAMPHR